MKHIVLFGAGKSSTILIQYLKELALEQVWQITVADGNIALAQAKTGTDNPLVKALEIDITSDADRKALIQQSSLVISMMPPHLHYLIALDCLTFEKHLLTASYVDEQLKALAPTIASKNLLFLCEMGLDPGIDHMSAMQLIHKIKAAGGKINSFKSHCGGLIAPESDNNPWHYKISWNPRNIILAGKAGATFKTNHQVVHTAYEQLFNPEQIITTTDGESYAWYANRDSLSYIPLYDLADAATFIRTTLRHPEFCFGWRNIVQLKLTDEQKKYATDGMTYAQFFHEHFQEHGLNNWISELMLHSLTDAKDMMEQLMHILEAEEQAKESGDDVDEEVFMVNEKGELNAINIEETKEKAAAAVAIKMHEANLSMRQLFFLGLDDETPINKGLCCAADVLQALAEKKLALEPSDKDMIVMLHEIAYTAADQSDRLVQSLLKIVGHNSVETAMAATVGLPLGIAAKLILEGTIQEKGLLIPTLPSIYEPVLAALAARGIAFTETETHL